MTLADLLCPESSVRLPHEGMRALRIAPAAPVSG